MARISKRQNPGNPWSTPDEQARKAALFTELDGVGWFLRGSLLRVANRCGNPSCRCKADPPRLHGPYWQWSRKVAGKTVSVRLTDAQAGLVRAWIANSKRFDQKIAELDQLTLAVTDRILAAVDNS
jgi:Family of unknown function (DUF6788)